jgi:hypothetical protein
MHTIMLKERHSNNEIKILISKEGLQFSSDHYEMFEKQDKKFIIDVSTT